MTGLTRYDFFRLVLPGAAAVFLGLLVGRVISVTPGLDVLEVAALRHALDVAGNPFVAFASAFAIGLFLYFVDPAYGAPEYWKGIPSTHLRKWLDARGVQADELSLYFHAIEKLMPVESQERALLYGGLFRLAFQVIVFLLLAAVAIPTTILAMLPADHGVTAPPFGRPWLLATAVIAAATLATPFVREALRSRDKQSWPSSHVAALVLPGTLVGSVLWLDVAYDFLPGDPDRVLTLLATLVVVMVWLVLRLSGPFDARLAYWRGTRKKKPDEPYRPMTVALLDGSVSVVALAGTLSLSSRLLDVQLAAVGALVALGLLLGFLRKHERQLHGIYRNHSRWLDWNIDAVIALTKGKGS